MPQLPVDVRLQTAIRSEATRQSQAKLTTDGVTKMVAFGSRGSARSGPSYGHLIVAAVAVATLSAACSPRSDGTASTPSPSASPLAKAAIERAVLDAWRDEHAAYADALRAMDPNHPDLAKTAIDPVLSSARAFITLSKQQGLVARGEQDLGIPKVLSLTPADDPSTAIVESCVHDRLLLYDRKGKPVSGTAGQVTWNHERTTLRRIPGIGWLVADNVVRQGPTEAICVQQ